MIADDAAFVFRLGRSAFGGISVVTSATNKILRGSGPVPGVIEVSPRVQSTKVLQYYYPKQGGIEFVFDPKTNTFAVGKPHPSTGFTGSPHQKLAQSIGAEEATLVGGTFRRGENGEILTDELSGHYGEKWTDSIRKQFVQFMEEATGLVVNHIPW